MTSRRLKGLAAFVALLAFVQIFFEDVLIFIEATGVAPPGVLNSPLAFMAIPLIISALLVIVLIGSAILYAETLR